MQFGTSMAGTGNLFVYLRAEWFSYFQWNCSLEHSLLLVHTGSENMKKYTFDTAMKSGTFYLQKEFFTFFLPTDENMFLKPKLVGFFQKLN